MTIDFTRNDRPTIGVELELHLVDAVSGDLVSAANEVLDEMAVGHEGVSTPRRSTSCSRARSRSSPACATPRRGACRPAGDARRAARSADARGLRSSAPGPIRSGSPASRRQPGAPLPRADRGDAVAGAAAADLRHARPRRGARRRAGDHDHQRAEALAAAAPRAVVVEPVLRGRGLGPGVGARRRCSSRCPPPGLPPQLADWVDFEAFMSTLLDSECISSIREVWWDIRPHPEFGTIEIRMFDAPQTLGEVEALAALAQALVAWCDERIEPATCPRLRASGRSVRTGGSPGATASTPRSSSRTPTAASRSADRSESWSTSWSRS